MATIHEPVMLEEVLRFLDPHPGQNFIDCTFGGGGHSLAILEKVRPGGRVVGIDCDPHAVQDSENDGLILINDNYRNLKDIIKRIKSAGKVKDVNGILLDLGLSSDQLAADDRGFGFSGGELDLRFDASGDGIKAYELLRDSTENEIRDILKEYGEEPLAGPIARKIAERNKSGEIIIRADDLAELVAEIYRRRFPKPSKKHPATRVFQALRIAVNDEYGNINAVLPKAIDSLSSGGRLAVITFHSGEDRIVKNIFKELASGDNPRIKMLTRKPISPSDKEVKDNPRSRSAKLRVIERI